MKPGIDFFPLDVDLDEKWELIEAEFGLIGFSVVVKLLQRIYGGQGYYCEWTNEVALLFTKRLGLGGSVVSQIVSAAVKRGIFDKTLYEKYAILTSGGIQKRYFEAVSRRKSVKVDPRYLLVPYTQKSSDDSKNEENVNIFSENVDNFKQSKVEESKVNNTPPIAPARGTYQNVYLTDSEYADLKAAGIPDSYIDYFSKRIKESGYNYDCHHDFIRKWWEKDRKKAPWNGRPKEHEGSFDTDEFFQAALRRSQNQKKDNEP